MFRTLKDLLDSLTASSREPTPEERARAVQLATAVLLVEVLRADAQVEPSEREATLQALRERFELNDNELEHLMTLAQDTAKTAYDYQRFTSELNAAFTQTQKIEVVEAMWRVAYADDHLDANENHVISKVAGLLHVTHGEYIAAKMRAKEASHAG